MRPLKCYSRTNFRETSRNSMIWQTMQTCIDRKVIVVMGITFQRIIEHYPIQLVWFHFTYNAEVINNELNKASNATGFS